MRAFDEHKTTLVQLSDDGPKNKIGLPIIDAATQSTLPVVLRVLLPLFNAFEAAPPFASRLLRPLSAALFIEATSWPCARNLRAAARFARRKASQSTLRRGEKF